MKKTILYIGNFEFPDKNAGGKRVYANGKILRELGYEVIFIGMDKKVKSKEIYFKEGLEKSMYDGFTYYNFSYPHTNYEWVTFCKVYNFILNIIKEEKISAGLCMIITYGSIRLSLLNYKLLKHSNINHIKFVVDSVDWFDIKTQNPIFNFIKWADDCFKRTYLCKHADGIITISKFLSRYYKEKGKKTVVIPPLSPVKLTDFKIEEKILNEKIITYAGQPFRIGEKIKNLETLKDRIDKTIILLSEVKKRGSKFKFQIYGITKDDYLFTIPSHKSIIEYLGESVIFHGVVDNEVVLNSIAKSDFTILIRDINRATMAGFPTKIAESISCGTPVITTKTSDLEDYVIEGENGFFLNVKNEAAMIYKLKNILNLRNEKIKDMKRHCLSSRRFAYINYIEKFEHFFYDLGIGKQ